MIAQCVEDMLAAGMGEVHLFIGKDGTILTRAKREKDERSSLSWQVFGTEGGDDGCT